MLFDAKVYSDIPDEHGMFLSQDSSPYLLHTEYGVLVHVKFPTSGANWNLELWVVDSVNLASRPSRARNFSAEKKNL
jgi:hypothetical protein